MDNEKEKITLKDIAGYQEEKEEARKLIEILSHYDIYKEKGVSIPKGLILSGEPGVGKTMLAKAIATEAGVPIHEFEIDESENEEESIAGLRNLFAKAKEHTPSIIFIDELDELVTNVGFESFETDYSRKTLKILLTEIDGIQNSEGVLVIATTNSRASLPKALLRSGRMEKRISFSLPTVSDRKAIYDLYLKKYGIEGISSIALAEKTGGFSGADIKAHINETMLESVMKGVPVTLSLFESVIPVIRFSEIKKQNPGGPKAHVIYHEIGHFLVRYALCNELSSISVQRFGEILGYNAGVEVYAEISTEEPIKKDSAGEEVEKQIAVALGGLAGEMFFLKKNYLGCSSDLNQTRNTFNWLCNNAYYGFNCIPGFKERFGKGGSYSIATSFEDKSNYETKYIQVLEENYDKAMKAIEKYQDLGRMLFDCLKKTEVLSKEDIIELLKGANYEIPA